MEMEMKDTSKNINELIYGDDFLNNDNYSYELKITDEFVKKIVNFHYTKSIKLATDICNELYKTISEM